ncbi:hypothetical protein JKP88DRAFT_251282 [Tribonema minus]|uniref:Uncharacterized protein n=1 Tax=Tribonema minus TaxID=303371 RepID=A0A835ZGD7_9STRA|nr:hypothetical protein JKP88DRAFT_251282 [Tribonema minus]
MSGPPPLLLLPPPPLPPLPPPRSAILSAAVNAQSTRRRAHDMVVVNASGGRASYPLRSCMVLCTHLSATKPAGASRCSTRGAPAPLPHHCRPAIAPWPPCIAQGGQVHRWGSKSAPLVQHRHRGCTTGAQLICLVFPTLLLSSCRKRMLQARHACQVASACAAEQLPQGRAHHARCQRLMSGMGRQTYPPRHKGPHDALPVTVGGHASSFQHFLSLQDMYVVVQAWYCHAQGQCTLYPHYN